MRKYAGKLNHLKTSDNLDIGTKKNVLSDSIGRNINRIDEHQKLWVQVGRGVTAKKKKPENVRLSRTGIMAHTKYSDDWELANWKGLRKVLFRLQKRIFKAVKDGDKANARKLQKVVLFSHAVRMLAIRQVTQLNQGKKTAGIYGKKFLTFKERSQLEKTLQ
jgi:N-terminal domain of reverse transcriptase